jgi:5-deoxy-D-glucuronate isomerase
MADVDVAIYKDSELFFEESFDNVIKVERRYDVTSMPKGKYSVVVSTDYKTYYKELVIK